jgi:hypothetical protein
MANGGFGMSRTVMTRLGTLIIALGFLGLTANPAGAAPTNAKNAELIDLSCANGATYSIVANGNGDYSPGHILDGEGTNLIPVAFHFVVTDESGTVLFDETIAKPGQMNGLSDDLIDCTFTTTDTDPDTGETVTVNGSVTLFVAPRR